jgi:hypothetical protein
LTNLCHLPRRWRFAGRVYNEVLFVNSTRYHKLSRNILRLVIPLTAAFVVVRFENRLAAFAQDHPGILPVTLVALVAGLLYPAIRRWLIVTLCFGVGMLAMRDAFSVMRVPEQIDYLFLESLYPYGWGLLALLACTAGAVEALSPGSVWARRCYFGAAFLYFFGHGALSFLRMHNWQSVVLMMSGLCSLYGIFTARRVVATELEMEAEDEDLRALEQQRELRAQRLAACEWHETPGAGVGH